MQCAWRVQLVSVDLELGLAADIWIRHLLVRAQASAQVTLQVMLVRAVDIDKRVHLPEATAVATDVADLRQG